MTIANLNRVLELQQNCYDKRKGTVYGDFRVENVWYDWDNRKQMWEMKCVNCGKVKVTSSGQDYVKGKNKGSCSCCRIRAKALQIPEIKKKEDDDAPNKPKWIGQVFGKWEVKGYESNKGWLVECIKCHRQTYHYVGRIKGDKKPLCTCDRVSEYADPNWIGQRFGHLVVQKYIKGGRLECKCDCGNVVAVHGSHLSNRVVITCGKDCPHHIVANRTHGLSNDRLYRIWYGMKRRCYDTKSQAYPTYGGRGINICEEWREDVFAFREWALSHGYADELSIDRIDNDKGYSPDNCRWATAKEQANNQHPRYTFTPINERKPYRKKKLKTWTIDGVTKPILEWCQEANMSVQAVTYRVMTKGMSPKEALTVPKQQGSHKFNVVNSLESAEQRGIIE